MAEISSCPPLTRQSVLAAHEIIKPYIHRTPVLTCNTLTLLASSPQSTFPKQSSAADHHPPAHPKMNLFFKCENFQKIGAFKARGAFHALSRLSQAERDRGVVTHSSGNHAQALALAARTLGVDCTVVMPSISTPSKIAGTKSYGAEVVFSGSTAEEREAVVAGIMSRTGKVLVPPYDHPDVILGQGTLAVEMQEQVEIMLGSGYRGTGEGRGGCSYAAEGMSMPSPGEGERRKGLDAVIAPCGGGGMLSGVATALAGTGIRVFGAEPEFEGADDARRGLAQGKRIDKVKTLTIADGLRTPVGEIPWSVISDKDKVKGMFSVSEEQIKSAMRLMLERAKIFIEPSAAVGVAVALYNEEFRRLVQTEAGEAGWNVGVVLTGGNTTVDAIAKLYAPSEAVGERQEGKVGMNGERVAENVAG